MSAEQWVDFAKWLLPIVLSFFGGHTVAKRRVTGFKRATDPEVSGKVR